eukprot:4451522-Prorocentrum_lima.AAC.1
MGSDFGYETGHANGGIAESLQGRHPTAHGNSEDTAPLMLGTLQTTMKKAVALEREQASKQA